MADIGPGPLMCIKGTTCPGCGQGVREGVMYQCTRLHQLSFFEEILYGGCVCGEHHPWVGIAENNHVYCPGLFAPLGDPDAVIRETDEPSDTKRREDEGYGTNPAMPDIRKIKETENV